MSQEGRDPKPKDAAPSQETRPENTDLEAEFNELLNEREQLRLQLEQATQQALGDSDVDYGLEQTFKKKPEVLEKLKGLDHADQIALLNEVMNMPWNRFGKLGELKKVVNSEASSQLIALDAQIDTIYKQLHPEQG